MYYEDADLCFAARERGLPRGLRAARARRCTSRARTAGHRHRARRQAPPGAQPRRSSSRSGATAARPSSCRHPRRARAPRERPQPRTARARHRPPRARCPTATPARCACSSCCATLLELGCRVTFMPGQPRRARSPTPASSRALGVEVLYGTVDVHARASRRSGPDLRLAIVSRPYVAARYLAPHPRARARRARSSSTPSTCTTCARSAAPSWTAGAATDEGRDAAASSSSRWSAASDVTIVGHRGRSASSLLARSPARDVDRRARRQRDPAEAWRRPPIATGCCSSAASSTRRTSTPCVCARARRSCRSSGASWATCRDDRRRRPAARGARARELRRRDHGLGGGPRPAADSSSRVMVAPLRYGAGMKGKVTQSLAAGLPVVTTTIGAEGLGRRRRPRHADRRRPGATSPTRSCA